MCVTGRRARRVPRRTGPIALVVCADNSRVFSEPFFPLMLRSISRELSARGIQLVLSDPGADRGRRLRPRRRRARPVPVRQPVEALGERLASELLALIG